MPEKKGIFVAQRSLLLLALFSLMTAISSCQKDKTDDLNITRFQWELKSVTHNDNEYNKPDGDFQNPNAYVLRFESDTTFWLDFSINAGLGTYTIMSGGNIGINSYNNISEAAMTDFDEKLLSGFRTSSSYTVKGTTLTFQGNNGEVEFKRK